MDPQSRIQMTNDFIGSIHVPSAPPTGFDPLQADHETLIKHGLPLSPNRHTHPEDYDKWQHLMNHARTFIAPKFDVVEDAPPGEYAGGLAGDRWAGAVDVNSDAKNSPYRQVKGSWIVPRAYPLTVDWTEWGWKNRNYRSATWVGIDGYHTKNAHVLQAGTTVNCDVSPRQTTTHETYAWVEWIAAPPARLTNFEINSGDLITCIVESPDPSKLDHAEPNKTGRVMMFNRSTCNYSTAHMVMPSGGKAVKGETAEWIVEGPDCNIKREGRVKQAWSDYKLHTPFLGATFIYDCQAVKSNMEIENLKHALLVNQEQKDPELKMKVVNTAVKENDHMVGIFSAPTTPVWTQIDEVHGGPVKKGGQHSQSHHLVQ